MPSKSTDAPPRTSATTLQGTMSPESASERTASQTDSASASAAEQR